MQLPEITSLSPRETACLWIAKSETKFAPIDVVELKIEFSAVLVFCTPNSDLCIGSACTRMNCTDQYYICSDSDQNVTEI